MQICYTNIMKNPFIYSNDNKRYHTFNYYLKNTYHEKIFKVPLDGGFTCPNRDGSKAFGGCTFCSALGSGDSIIHHEDIMQQFDDGVKLLRKKWPNGKGMAYFQAYTNTYGPLEKLKNLFEPFIQREDVVALCIATRADCLNDENIAYLDSLTVYKDVWVEVGLQTIHDETAQRVNRAHDYACFLKAIEKLADTNCKICVHIINGLPYETKDMMLETIQAIAQLPIHAVKIHMLHLLKNTAMADEYEKKHFHILTLEEYVEIVCEQLTYLPKEIIIERLTGDGIASELIAPLWKIKKVCVLNEIDKYMARHELYQGMNYKKNL